MGLIAHHDSGGSGQVHLIMGQRTRRIAHHKAIPRRSGVTGVGITHTGMEWLRRWI